MKARASLEFFLCLYSSMPPTSKDIPIPLDESPRSEPYSDLNVNNARRLLCKQFEQAGLSDCEAEARELVMAATGLSRSELITQGADFMLPEALGLLQNYSARRISGEPVDHILGWREFYGRRFNINSDVLSPRQETEEVVANALSLIANIKSPHILDLGTGSGAIAITLLAERPDATGLALDYSNAALSIAENNSKAHGTDLRLKLLQSDWFENAAGEFDLIISNPPYIDSKAMKVLPREVANYDPEIALHGGEDGLSPYRIIAEHAKKYLKPNGYVVFEIGFDQGESVPEILTNRGFTQVALNFDIFGVARIVTARR